MKIRAIVTGATGMVGEGVMHECLLHPDVEQVLIINRKPSGFTHPKLKEIVHADLSNLAPLANQLSNYNACFFCAGVSSVGMNEADYTKITHDLTLSFAQTLVKLNPDMVFCYISGAGTDSTAAGKTMWARVKGKTENDLQALPFKRAYMFRPAFMKPTEGLKNTLKGYNFLGWLYPLLKLLAPNSASTLSEVGLAMINTVYIGYPKPVLEVPDIIKLAHVV